MAEISKDKRTFRLAPPFKHDGGFAWMVKVPEWPLGDDEDNRYRSTALLFENGKPLHGAHVAHDDIRQVGGGLYSHWKQRLFFSTLDNSDPNTNGRTYHVEFALTLDLWNLWRLRTATALWRFHPEADYFLSRGGDTIPPPMFCNLGLTNKCNLRCEICGSQKFLDETGVRRRHLDISKFLAVAETIFPFIVEVELNSQGDPLLHPQIDTILESIARYRCQVKVQTNGTLFTERINELFMLQHGTVMLSLDAVGTRFDKVRRGGDWAKAEPQLLKLLRQRDPRRLRVGVYPTLTKRTIQDAMNVVQWSFDQGIEEVAFHRYIPIQNSFEEEPSNNDLCDLKRRLEKWLERHGGEMEIKFDGIRLNRNVVPDRRTEFAHPEKRAFVLNVKAQMFPMDQDMPNADPVAVCVSPIHYMEIGLDGQIGACCRAQDVVLGYATSVREFADAWFGENYRKIRKSLRRDDTAPFPLPNCESCIKFFAPKTAPNRRALKYDSSDNDHPEALVPYNFDVIKLEVIQKETGFCHIAVLPLGIKSGDFELWEDKTRLGPAASMHDDIRNYGRGRYSIWGRALYFSTSDNSDARRNGYSYTLRRIQSRGINSAVNNLGVQKVDIMR